MAGWPVFFLGAGSAHPVGPSPLARHRESPQVLSKPPALPWTQTRLLAMVTDGLGAGLPCGRRSPRPSSLRRAIRLPGLFDCLLRMFLCLSAGVYFQKRSGLRDLQRESPASLPDPCRI